MKKTLLAIAVVAAAFGLSSCDRRPDVAGSWAGEASLPVEGASTSYARVIYDLNADGSVMATYDIDFTKPLPQSTQIVSPYQTSVSATATISGTWQWIADEDDELLLTFDPSTLKANVDPHALEMRANVITDEQAPELDSLRPQIAAIYLADIEQSIRSHASSIVLDDVKADGKQLSFEIGDKKYVYSSVSPAAE